MRVPTQDEIVSLIWNINLFAEKAEQQINADRSGYEQEKKRRESRYQNLLGSLKNGASSSCSSVRSQSEQMLADAQKMLTDIVGLDQRLSGTDKYYVKTKKKKEEELASRTNEKYAGTSDYFQALRDIKGDFERIYGKYAQSLLPGVVDGLNFLLSSQRKKEYEELIILLNTVVALVKEMKSELPLITEETVASIEEEYELKKGVLEEQRRQEMSVFENNHLRAINQLADQIYQELDKLLPDDQIEQLVSLTENYRESRSKVNSSEETPDAILDMWFMEFCVTDFVQSEAIVSVILEKCSPLMENGVIRFPIIMSAKNAQPWMIAEDGSDRAQAREVMHARLFSLLSALPVAGLTCTVVDPENRGNSIAPFFEARKKLPELFGEKIYTGREDIAAKIGRLNEYIEHTLQENLGNQYESVFDYARAEQKRMPAAEMLLLFDFPAGFDEYTTAALRNILRNGSKCGVYTMISYLPDVDAVYSREYEQNMRAIQELVKVLRQEEKKFVFSGLPVSYYPMPEKGEFAKFFSKYMLIYEGIKNRGIAFSPTVKKLVEAKDSLELDEHIRAVARMTEHYEKTYGTVPDEKMRFPSQIMLGKILYPADIFAESTGYQRIMEHFGVSATGAPGSGFVELPLTFDLGKSFNLLLHCPETAHRQMLAFTHHIIWNFLSFLPAMQVKICVFDSEQRGNSIIPFLDFRKRSPDTFDQKIYTSQEAMYEKLRAINARIDEFIQEKLGNRYRNILEYNQNTPSRAESVTLLLLYDFPGQMDSRCLDCLANILRNGNKCGVYTVLCYNPEISYSRYENITERMEHMAGFYTSIEYKNGCYSMLPYNLQIKIPAELTGIKAEEFVDGYAEACEAVKKRGISFEDIIRRELFGMKSASVLKIPVGIGDEDAVVQMIFGEGSSHHGLIAGATGSGKSTLLHTLIMSGMLHYSPEQLNLYLMDFKSGTEFKIYENYRLPHIKLLALDAMQEFGESILEKLVEEMERRGALFKSAGQTSLKGYTQSTGNALPRILVVMDEFQILFNASTNRKVAMNCAGLTNRIVTEGRAFGIHLLMATQSTKVIADLTLSYGTIEQMRIRVGLKCGESDVRYLFADQDDSRILEMMKGPIGTAVMNQDYTERSSFGFRTAYCGEQQQRQYLEQISKAFADQPHTLQTFEGGRTTNLYDFFRENGIGHTREMPVRIYVGELIKAVPKFALTIDKKKKQNMLVCGSDEQLARRITDSYMVSALLNDNTRVYCVDGDCILGDGDCSDIYRTLKLCGTRFRLAEKREDIFAFINEVYDLYQAAKKNTASETVFVFIKNLQFLDIIKSMFKGEKVDEEEFMVREEPEEPDFSDPFAAINNMFAGGETGRMLSCTEKLLRLINEGTGFGIHFVVTSIDWQTVRETMYYSENILAKFPQRMIFAMSGSDADNLIDNVEISALRDNTVYFTDGVRNTFQMKPFVCRADERLGKLLNPLADGTGSAAGAERQKVYSLVKLL